MLYLSDEISPSVNQWLVKIPCAGQNVRFTLPRWTLRVKKNHVTKSLRRIIRQQEKYDFNVNRPAAEHRPSKVCLICCIDNGSATAYFCPNKRTLLFQCIAFNNRTRTLHTLYIILCCSKRIQGRYIYYYDVGIAFYSCTGQ